MQAEKAHGNNATAAKNTTLACLAKYVL